MAKRPILGLFNDANAAADAGDGLKAAGVSENDYEGPPAHGRLEELVAPDRNFIGFSAVDSEEDFHCEEVEPAGGDHNQQSAQGVDMLVPDVFLPTVDASQDDQYEGHRRDTGVYRPHHEVGSKDAGMPGLDRLDHADNSHW